MLITIRRVSGAVSIFWIQAAVDEIETLKIDDNELEVAVS